MAMWPPPLQTMGGGPCAYAAAATKKMTERNFTAVRVVIAVSWNHSAVQNAWPQRERISLNSMQHLVAERHPERRIDGLSVRRRRRELKLMQRLERREGEDRCRNVADDARRVRAAVAADDELDDDRRLHQRLQRPRRILRFHFLHDRRRHDLRVLRHADLHRLRRMLGQKLPRG